MAGVRHAMGWLTGRRGAVLLLSGLWIVVIAAGAGRAADSTTWLGLPSLDWLTYVMVACMVLGGIILVTALILAPKQGDQQPAKRRPMWPLLLLVLVFLILSQREPGRRGDGVEAAPPPSPAEAEPVGGSAGAGSLERDELALLLAILAIALGVLAVSRRPRDDPWGIGEDESLERALVPAVNRATEHLLSDRDPRSAVLMAYHSVEAALSARDRPRAPNETPAEHLRRALATLPIDTEALLRLADLYQVARFSTHPITRDQQQEAASALQRVRSQLAAST